MKSANEKSTYSTPMIFKVVLDNEISLQLQSDPPDGPGEMYGYEPDYYGDEGAL